MISYSKLTIKDEKFDCKNKKVLMRVDYNVPLNKKTGKISDETRIKRTIPSINFLINKGASQIVLMSHMGRPQGRVNPKMSLAIVGERLENLLNKKVIFLKDCVGKDTEESCNEKLDNKECKIILLENLRFHIEETGKGVDEKGNKIKATEENTKKFRQSLTKLGEIYVNDAFGAAHRAHSSIVGIDLKIKASGLLLAKELEVFGKALTKPVKPFLSILGGAKVKDKIQLIDNLLDKVDEMIIVGGMAYTFLKTCFGMKIGKSLFDKEGAKIVQSLLDKAKKNGVNIHLPIDFVCADDFSNDANRMEITVENGIKDDWEGLDIGSKSREKFAKVIENSKTIVWNGPAGVFEFENFAKGSKAILESVVKAKKNNATTIIGGGDTASLVVGAGKENEVSHISTGGGASLELLEGKILPGVDILNSKE